MQQMFVTRSIHPCVWLPLCSDWSTSMNSTLNLILNLLWLFPTLDCRSAGKNNNQVVLEINNVCLSLDMTLLIVVVLVKKFIMNPLSLKITPSCISAFCFLLSAFCFLLSAENGPSYAALFRVHFSRKTFPLKNCWPCL